MVLQPSVFFSLTLDPSCRCCLVLSLDRRKLKVLPWQCWSVGMGACLSWQPTSASRPWFLRNLGLHAKFNMCSSINRSCLKDWEFPDPWRDFRAGKRIVGTNHFLWPKLQIARNWDSQVLNILAMAWLNLVRRPKNPFMPQRKSCWITWSMSWRWTNLHWLWSDNP